MSNMMSQSIFNFNIMLQLLQLNYDAFLYSNKKTFKYSQPLFIVLRHRNVTQCASANSQCSEKYKLVILKKSTLRLLSLPAENPGICDVTSATPNALLTTSNFMDPPDVLTAQSLLSE